MINLAEIFPEFFDKPKFYAEINAGWDNLLVGLLTTIRGHYRNNETQRDWTEHWNAKGGEQRPVPLEVEPLRISQIKEKFGSLRFYYSGGDDWIAGAVDLAERLSERTCEQCGGPGEMRHHKSLVYTSCEKHDSLKNRP